MTAAQRWPVLAASLALFRDGRVLLARRGFAPMRHLFSLPGGRVEPGERLADAARRELLEETGLHVGPIAFVGHVEAIENAPDGTLAHHFVVCAFAGRWAGGEPVLTSEAREYRWADPATLDGLPVTHDLHRLVGAAVAALGQGLDEA